MNIVLLLTFSNEAEEHKAVNKLARNILIKNHLILIISVW